MFTWYPMTWNVDEWNVFTLSTLPCAVFGPWATRWEPQFQHTDLLHSKSRKFSVKVNEPPKVPGICKLPFKMVVICSWKVTVMFPPATMDYSSDWVLSNLHWSSKSHPGSVWSRLGFCNSLYSGLSHMAIPHLRLIQKNGTCRLLANA